MIDAFEGRGRVGEGTCKLLVTRLGMRAYVSWRCSVPRRAGTVGEHGPGRPLPNISLPSARVSPSWFTSIGHLEGRGCVGERRGQLSR